MVKADYQTTKNCPFSLDVRYIINHASKVGRIAKKFADTKFTFGGFCNYDAVYGFNSKEQADACKAALDAAFAGVDGVTVGTVADTYMEKVETEIYIMEHEKV